MRTPPPRTVRGLVPLVLAVALVGSTASPAAAGPPGRPAPPPAPTFTDATVHDPSVVVADDEIWAFGSHLQVAKTDDLLHWEQVAAGVTPDNPIFEDVTAELAEALEWAQTDTLWAADVIQLGDGRFYMYYNACKGDSPRSAMGVAVADSVDGPYEDLGIFLRSGMWDQPSEDGEIYDARIHPNVVDPDTFVDAEGRLWMVYGSYSGGIFILEMDPATGFPLPGQGYGTHLLGGNHSRIEAPNIMFDEDTGYYYMFLSFGGLDANGGYNMRVVRSKNPDGPYVDAEGNDMSQVRSDPSLPLFDDASIAPYGVKVMGNHIFQREVGDPGTGLGTGYVSPGHNSTYTDPETGKQFLVFHSRFPGQGETHNVRVHELAMNARGWPVVAPYRYAGEPPATKGHKHHPETISRSDVVGDYALIDHGKAISADVTRAVDVRLEPLGRISGDRTGWWLQTGRDRVHMLVDGVLYDGALLRQWQPDRQEWVVTFSVQSRAGVSLWGSAVAPMSAKDAVAAVVADLDLGDTSAVVADLALPTTGTHGTTITWASSDPAVVSPTGEVTRPEHGAGDATVTLTATVRNERRTATTRFTLTVLERAAGGLVGAWSFEGDLAEASGALPAGTVTGPRVDAAGGTVSYVEGVEGQAVQLDGASGVRLPDGLISGPTYTVSLWVRPDVVTGFTTTFFGARDPESWVSVVPQGPDGSTMVWSGTAWYDASTGGTIPAGEWSHLTLTVDGGDVAVYVDGAQRFTGTGFPNVFTTATGTFALGVNWWDTPFAGAVDELTVHGSALTAEEVAALAAR
ncbi:LamG-like jellyroll fold domain-containing protein [Cellulomonas shaoxiangyii]|uniref:Glycoside hydrolase family 43 n=1 Tax=Cellulomonas shaoxiangyii TaxID=2566013 RepID=A0A4P7SFC7_9CELL|nr:LamG-like jellyroll fold domain-containing protein [Cellulomonas shaoxiangyii]QCB92692.1 glycoside hydrolase family 43 [Cellulomonas shaoxiangyii]TGY85817.1 glycoside hydrolase family 43 [Cellulomonas shaoxiangyii]